MHHKFDGGDDDDEMTELVQYWVTLVVFEERPLQLLRTVSEVTITKEIGEDDIEDWEEVLASAELWLSPQCTGT